LKVIVAPDAFKGSLSAVDAAQAIAAGIHDYDPLIETILLPVADGGEGTMDSLIAATGGTVVAAVVQDPLGRQIEASYGVLGDGETCVIEIAEASGLTLLHEDELNPLIASTFGTGQLIVRALDAGFRRFVIGLGGSATNDGGAGVLQALGMKFLGKDSVELNKGGGALGKLHHIDINKFDSRVAESTFVIACDVENAFIGPEGASLVFGPQKGATPQMVKLLDQNLEKLATVIEALTGISLHEKKGAGAAGGTAGAFQAFFSGEMKQGINVVLEAVSFAKHVSTADLVITGEGKTDAQTFSGKAPFGVARAARLRGTQVILISGTIDQEIKESLASCFTESHAVADETVSKEESMTNACYYLRIKAKEVIGTYVDKSTD